MQERGRGAKVFDAAPVRGTLRTMAGPDDVLALMDTGEAPLDDPYDAPVA